MINRLKQLFKWREAPTPIGRGFAGVAMRMTRPQLLRPPGTTALINIDPAILARMLEAYEQGSVRQVQWLADQVSRRDATVRAVLERRASAVLDMEWDIRTVDDSPAAQAQADFLREIYDGLGNLREVLRHLCGAAHHGYSVCEIVRDGSGDILELACLPPWVFQRDGWEGPFHLTPAGESPAPGNLLPLDRVLLRSVPAPLLHVTLPAYLRKQLGIVDWCGFVETYGVPAMFMVMPQGVPAEQEAAYVAAAEAAISQSKGAMPFGTTLLTANGAGQNGETFEKFLAYLDGQIVMAATGGKLAVLNEPTGLGGSQGKTHADAFEQIARAEAGEISEVFHAGIDKPELARRFPGAPVLAYWELAAKESPDVGAIVEQVAKLAQAGYGVDTAQLAERTGYKLEVKAATPAPGMAPALLQNREETFDEAFAAALRLPGAERRAALEVLSRGKVLPAGAGKVEAKMAADMARALAAGAAETLKKP